MVAAVITLFSLVLSVPLMIYNALVVSCVWDWFVVPTFNVPSVSVGYMLGILLLVSIVRSDLADRSENKDAEKRAVMLLTSTLNRFFGTSLGWGIAAIVHAIVG